jgi:predicted ester cyclase
MGDNVGTIKRLEAAWAGRDYDTVKTILDPNFKNGGVGAAQMPPGIDGLIRGAEQSHSAFPDKKQELIQMFGEGDKVVSQVRMTGTNTGGLPWFGIPANDKPIDVQWITIYTMKDDKVVETTSQMDLALMMQQLGMGGN